MRPLRLPTTDPVQGSAWTSIHATAVHVLPGMLRFLGVAENDLDDLCQDVLLGALRSLPRYDPLYSSRAGAAAPLPPSGLLDSAAARVLATSPEADRAPGAPSDALPRPPTAPEGEPDPARPHLGENWRTEASWLFGIAWRKVSHHLQRAYRRREIPVGLTDAACFQQTGAAPSSEDHLAAKQRLALALRLLSWVEPERRAILILADAYDVPVREIASALSINENTAASRLRLARRDYRAAQKRLRPEEKRALRSSFLVLPLLSVASLRSVVEAMLPAGALAAQRSGARLDGIGWRARLARPFGRRLRPALGWIAAGVAWGVILAALVVGLARAPVAWARHVGPVAMPLLLARSARPEPEPEPEPRAQEVLGDAPRSGDTTRADDAPGPRAPTAPAIARPGQIEPAAPRRAPAPADPRENRLDEELALLDAASQALVRGERAAALEHIDAHARRYSDGRLNSAREQLRRRAEALPITTTGGPATGESATGGSAGHDRP